MTADHFHKKSLLRNLKVLTSYRNREKIEQNDKSSKTYRVSNRSLYIYTYIYTVIYIYTVANLTCFKNGGGWTPDGSSTGLFLRPFHVTCRLLMADFPSYIFFTRGETVATRTIHHGRRSTGILFTMEDHHPPEPLARVVSFSWSRALIRPKNSSVSAVFVNLHEINEARLLRHRCWCSDATRMDGGWSVCRSRNGWNGRWKRLKITYCLMNFLEFVRNLVVMILEKDFVDGWNCPLIFLKRSMMYDSFFKLEM